MPNDATPQSGFSPGIGWGGDGDDSFVPPQCWLCLHRSKEGPYCRAFLGGIPLAFQLNEIDHREPHEDDGGIHFERDPETSLAAYRNLDAMFRNVRIARDRD